MTSVWRRRTAEIKVDVDFPKVSVCLLYKAQNASCAAISLASYVVGNFSLSRN